MEKVKPNQVVLHSDNGAPMKGATLLARLQQLGVMPSFSRPSVSDDNAFSEALFRTLKYRPWYPEKAFANIAEARRWVERFVRWYNNEHLHSGIRCVTPQDRHADKKAYDGVVRKSPTSENLVCHPTDGAEEKTPRSDRQAA